MIGTLLEDLRLGYSLDAVKSRFKSKMHPLQYQRPQAPASRGTIEQAEKLVERLGIADSLPRRAARIEEMQLLWRPTPVKEDAPSGSGVFSHLIPKGPRTGRVSDLTNEIPSVVCTWRKFVETVLPNALRIQIIVPGNGDFVGFTSAVNTDAPPILQWDKEEHRNPVSWYRYIHGSNASNWGLSPLDKVNIVGLCYAPPFWNDTPTHFAKEVFAILPDMQDTHNPGGALFPETLRADLHSVRSVIEQYSGSADLQDRENGTANGICVVGGKDLTRMIVHTAVGVTQYAIDRID